MAKLKAFSLFESVIAITIISICIGLGTMIYANVVTSETPMTVYEAKAEIHRLFYNLKEQKQYFNETTDFEGYSIDQTLDFYQGNKAIYQVDYTVLIHGKTAHIQSFLLNNEENED